MTSGDFRHQNVSRIVYWCAHFGLIDKVVVYLESNLSPMFRCHHNRNILSGAILGGQQEVVKLILSKTYYQKDNITNDLKHLLLTDSDKDKNTPLHFAYARH